MYQKHLVNGIKVSQIYVKLSSQSISNIRLKNRSHDNSRKGRLANSVSFAYANFPTINPS
jgi:hypothetical protein